MKPNAPLEFVYKGAEPTRADLAIATEFPNSSRAKITLLFERRDVVINGKTAQKGDTVLPGSCVTLKSIPASLEDLKPIPNPTLSINVLFEDDSLVVLNKPAGYHCHPMQPGEDNTLANFLAASFPSCQGTSDDIRECGLVHRLDRDTTGVVIAAKTSKTWKDIRNSFKNAHIDKHYLALVSGQVGTGSSTEPISQAGAKAKLDHQGLPASTSWEPIETFSGHTLLRCQSRTGRRHQIRIHLANADHPIVGDPLYGGASLEHPATQGQFLHAESISFPHPTTNAPFQVEAPLSKHQADLLEFLRR